MLKSMRRNKSYLMTLAEHIKTTLHTHRKKVSMQLFFIPFYAAAFAETNIS